MLVSPSWGHPTRNPSLVDAGEIDVVADDPIDGVTIDWVRSPGAAPKKIATSK